MPDSARSVRQADGLDPVRALQRVLYRSAKQDRTRRFHALFDKLARSDVMWRAWVDVATNQGAPGVDVHLHKSRRFGEDCNVDRSSDRLLLLDQYMLPEGSELASFVEHKVPGWCLTVPTDAPHNYLAQVDMNEGYNDCRFGTKT